MRIRCLYLSAVDRYHLHEDVEDDCCFDSTSDSPEIDFLALMQLG